MKKVSWEAGTSSSK